MANRHAHKKLRAEIRARMAARGESYQQAYAHVATRRASATAPQTDLVPVSYYGIPLALATIEMHRILESVAPEVLKRNMRAWGKVLARANAEWKFAHHAAQCRVNRCRRPDEPLAGFGVLGSTRLR
jgi:hypothetical protein